jgi:hypothetical protein
MFTDSYATWWHWNIVFRLQEGRDRLVRWVAWHLPRSIAYHCFVRVYAKGLQAPGPDYDWICKMWWQ